MAVSYTHLDVYKRQVVGFLYILYLNLLLLLNLNTEYTENPPQLVVLYMLILSTRTHKKWPHSIEMCIRDSTYIIIPTNRRQDITSILDENNKEV